MGVGAPVTHPPTNRSLARAPLTLFILQPNKEVAGILYYLLILRTIGHVKSHHADGRVVIGQTVSIDATVWFHRFEEVGITLIDILFCLSLIETGGISLKGRQHKSG